MSWSLVPRIYIVLRILGQLQTLDGFIDQGINDLWFPFSASSLPKVLSLSFHDRFLETQQLVLTKAIDLENSSKGHAHFTRDEEFPYEVRGKLGEGGFGYVDRIYSPLSGREFARKRFRRGKWIRKSDLQSFVNELQNMRRIHHIHCVELVRQYPI
jgi:serine/threonine protein kinase